MKMHPKRWKVALLQPFVLIYSCFVGVVIESGHGLKILHAQLLIIAPSLKNVCIHPAKIHRVPRSTLHDEILKQGTNLGLKPYLNTAEETEFWFLVDAAKAGYGISRKHIISIAENVAKDKGILKDKRYTICLVSQEATIPFT